MKTFAEVCSHCKKFGYSKNEMNLICGYLVAKGVKTSTDEIMFRIGCGTLTDFIEWFESEEAKDVVPIYIGRCVHLKDGENCQVINMMYDELVLMNRQGHVALYNKEDVERMCNHDEAEDLLNGLAAIGLCFCEDCETIEPFHTAFEPIVDKVVDLVGMLGKENDAIAGYLEDICNTLPTAKLTTEARFQLCSIFKDLAIALSDEVD